jgi:pterin-4a-carbinolamine dehydratase/uncharacterized protein (DUF2267 family)
VTGCSTRGDSRNTLCPGYGRDNRAIAATARAVRHVVQYEELLESVTERAQLADPDDAKGVVKAVLAGIAHWVDVPERQAVADVLPLQLRYVMESPRPTVGGDLPKFLQFVAFVVDTTPERARVDTQAVLSVLGDTDAEAAARLRKVLPDEFAELFAGPAGETVPSEGAVPSAEAAAAPAAGPAELTADDIAALLRRLPGWRGNTRRLTRTVPLPPGADAAAIEEIHRVEAELDHHTQLKRGPEDLTLTLWTHSHDAVTELDVRLAERIHAILARL